jgi:hypothetical protein
MLTWKYFLLAECVLGFQEEFGSMLILLNYVRQTASVV